MFRNLRNEKKAISEEAAKKLLIEAPRGVLAVNICTMNTKVVSTSIACVEDIR